MSRKPEMWTDEELKILKIEYPWEDIPQLANKLNKSVYAIKNKSSNLSIFRYPLNLRRGIKSGELNENV